MIKDHQDLFNRYVGASRGIIYETSGSIARDLRELSKEAKDYADRNGLQYAPTKWEEDD